MLSRESISFFSIQKENTQTKFGYTDDLAIAEQGKQREMADSLLSKDVESLGRILHKAPS